MLGSNIFNTTVFIVYNISDYFDFISDYSGKNIGLDFRLF